MDTRDLQQGTQEWRAARVGLITGSMVASVLGVSPFMSRTAALRRMVRESMGDMDHYSNAAMDWGTEHEDEALRLYCALYAGGDDVSKTGLWTKGDIGASPDALVGSHGLLEIKCPYSKRNELRPVFDQPTPNTLPHYWHQVQAQLYVTDRQWCDFLQWTPHDHTIHRIHRDPDWLDDRADAFAAFMDDYADMRAQMAQGGPQERLSLSEGWEIASKEYAQAATEAATAKARLESARNSLIALAKANEVDHCEGAGVKVQKIAREGSVDWKGLAVATLGETEAKATAEDWRKDATVSWRVDITGEKT